MPAIALGLDDSSGCHRARPRPGPALSLRPVGRLRRPGRDLRAVAALATIVDARFVSVLNGTRSGASSLLQHAPHRPGRLSSQQRQAIAKIAFSLVEVVSATTQFKILDDGQPASGVGPAMVKLEERTFLTASLGTNERAPALVPYPHQPLHPRRDVTRPGKPHGSNVVAPFGPLSCIRDRSAAPLEHDR